MLVLSRSIGERVVIDDNIIVTILSISRGQVKLGIEAPLEVIINRKEIDERIIDYLQQQDKQCRKRKR